MLTNIGISNENKLLCICRKLCFGVFIIATEYMYI